jgi:glycosyltransferase involved in cell wall biosynthesis
LSKRRLLAVIGDATDRRTWSGIPYHLLLAAKPTGFLAGGLALHPERLRCRRALWNLGTLLHTGRYGGFQYTAGFLAALLAQEEPLEEVELVSHFPLLPAAGEVEQVSYFIDATLEQNFVDYDLGARLPGSVVREALQRERDNYHRAARVVCMSRWAAESVRTRYGVAAEKVHVVRAGANLDEERLRTMRLPEAPGRKVLRLGFVGKDWRRKGLPLLLSAAERIEAAGQPVRVVVVGPASGALPAHPLLEPAGFLDKLRDLERFVEVLAGTHFGCLLSSAEALGISTLEFLRLGVPVVGLAVGGIPDCITSEDGLLIPEHSTPAVIAGAVLEAWEPGRYLLLREGANRRAPDVTWAATVRQLEMVWGQA